MANIKQYTDKIRTAVYGKEVRGSLAEGMEAINNEVEANTKHVNDTVTDIENFKEEISKAEAIRVSSENSRKQEEKNRVSNEDNRKTNENTRISNENTRKANEENRTNSETSRKNNEVARVNNEDLRKQEETTRISNENIRKSNEEDRINSETSRKQEEKNRVANEDNRKSNENTRVSNENTRTNKFNELNSEAQKLIKDMENIVGGKKPTPEEIGAQPAESTKFTMQEAYIAVRTANRKINQYYEFYDACGWADIKCREVYAGNGYYKVYHQGNKPTPEDLGVVANDRVSESAAAKKIVQRDAQGDINVRAVAAIYPDGNYMKGALAFRSNDSTDNIIRYCNNPAAVREWLRALSNEGDTVKGTLKFKADGNEQEIYNNGGTKARGQVFKSDKEAIVGMVGALMKDQTVEKMFMGSTDSPWNGINALTVDEKGACFNNNKLTSTEDFQCNRNLAHGFRKTPDGMLEQWGQYSFTGSVKDWVITFPISFTTNPNMEVQIATSSEGAWQGNTYIYKGDNRSTCRIIFLNGLEKGNYTIFWRALGY